MIAPDPLPPRHASTYAPRAKLGLIVPPTNTVNEAEWARMMPPGVTFHTTRMRLHETATPAQLAGLYRDLDAAIGLLAQARVDVVAYGCTAGSMFSPPEQLAEAVGARTGARVVTTAAAIVAALRALGARRLVVATPYHDALNEHERHFLEACGFKILALSGRGIGAGGADEYPRIAETPLAELAAQVREIMRPDAEALLISCTDFPSLALIEKLEAEFDMPVISSNSATLWAALREADIDDAVQGGGRLFAL